MCRSCLQTASVCGLLDTFQETSYTRLTPKVWIRVVIVIVIVIFTIIIIVVVVVIVVFVIIIIIIIIRILTNIASKYVCMYGMVWHGMVW